MDRQPIINPDFLLTGYSTGYFPMAESGSGKIRWYSPDPRAIIPLDTFRISRSLRQTLKKNVFSVRFDSAFEEVIRACAAREETWISEEIILSYVKLFELGFAHSVETWNADGLAGGLYGVALGGAFFGESMFSRATVASKVALVGLVERLRERNYELLDTQFSTPHLLHFGTIEVPRNEYLHMLKKVVRLRRSFAGTVAG
jgi:leucyl/phenylalanyl-tRNA---protein transferase